MNTLLIESKNENPAGGAGEGAANLGTGGTDEGGIEGGTRAAAIGAVVVENDGVSDVVLGVRVTVEAEAKKESSNEKKDAADLDPTCGS